MTSRYDVAIIAMNFPPEPTGIAPYSGGLAAGLHEAGLHVIAHVAHPHYPGWTIDKGYGQWLRVDNFDGIAVHRRLHYVPRHPRGIRRLVSELSYGVRMVFARWGNPHVIVGISPSLFTLTLAILKMKILLPNTSFIIWVQKDLYSLGLEETGQAKSGSITARIIRSVESFTLRSADRVIMIHEMFAPFIEKQLKVDPTKLITLRNWTRLPPSSEVGPHEARMLLGWPVEATLIVHTGNMGVKQGLENVISAAAYAEGRDLPLHFVLVGDGSERDRLRNLAEGVSKISFVEPLDADLYGLALTAADILLVNERPGVAAMAAPSKLTSYFHAGRPIVAATDAEGITASEIRAAKAGVVVPAGHPDKLAQAVMAMRAAPEEMAAYSANGRQYCCEVLEEKTVIERWVDLIRQLALMTEDKS